MRFFRACSRIAAFWLCGSVGTPDSVMFRLQEGTRKSAVEWRYRHLE